MLLLSQCRLTVWRRDFIAQEKLRQILKNTAGNAAMKGQRNRGTDFFKG